MIVGFTGTRRGMTPLQTAALNAALLEYAPELFVHGGCHGADAEADAVAYMLGIARRARPGPDSNHWQEGAEVMERKPNLDRNLDIVADADVLVAAPSNYTDIPRGSGTWHTVRAARSTGTPIHFLWNDGSVTRE
jgi:hypothetical protein